MRDISKKTFWIIIIALILTRVVMVVFLMQDIPPIGVATEQGYQLHLSNNEVTYFKLAKSFTDVNTVPVSTAFIGFPLYLTPFIYIFQASEINDILKPVFIFQAFILFSLAIIFIGLIAGKILKNRLAGILAASIFTFLPYVFYFLFKNIGPVYDGVTNITLNFSHLMWIRLLSDPLSAFLVYLSVCLFLILNKKINNKHSMLLGILSGLAVLVRMTNIFIVGVFVLILLVQKKIRKAGLVAIFSFLAFLPQLIYGKLVYGSSLFIFKAYSGVIDAKRAIDLYGDAIQFKSIAYPGFSINNYQYILFLIDKYIPKAELVLIFLVILFVFGMAFLYQRNRMGLLVIMLWLVPYSAFYGLFPPAARGIRYHLPIIPPLIILGICSLFFIFQRLKELTVYFRKKYAKFSA